MDEYLEALADDMKSALGALQTNLAKIRTGRATPKLLEGVKAMAYGTSMPLNQLATVKAPDARLLVITPFDKSTIGEIERGIVSAGLGLNPGSDGQVIRVPVPPLTAERRRDLVKQVKKYGEDNKVRIRKIRREYNDIFKSAEKDGDCSEDDLRRLLSKVQVATDKTTKDIDKLLEAKEAEVLEV